MRVARVRGAWQAIIVTSVAGGVAWSLARVIVGTPAPFFAPAAAVISLGVARGQPRRRAAELAIGVAIGIGVADLLRTLIGVGPVQIGAIVALTIVLALLVGAATLLLNQAVISAVLVITVPAGGAVGADRFFDALIGGAVALVTSQLVFVRNPTGALSPVVRSTLAELAGALRDSAQALLAHTPDLSQHALRRLRALDGQIMRLFEELTAAEEAALLSPGRRRLRGELGVYGDAARQVDYAVRNARVLMRGIATALRTGVEVPGALAEAILTLAAAADALAAQLIDSADELTTRRLATLATEQATGVLADHHDLRTSVIIGQIRATAVDLLRASGLDADSARAAIPEVRGEEL
jgi:hypothetical protein